MVSCFLRLGMGRLVRNPLVGSEVNRRVLDQILGEKLSIRRRRTLLAEGPRSELRRRDHSSAIAIEAALWGVIVNHHLAAMMRNQPISAFRT
jgi:hypothetical protein